MEAIWPDYYRETMQTKFQDSANIFWGCLQLNYVRPLQSARNVIENTEPSREPHQTHINMPKPVLDVLETDWKAVLKNAT